MRSYKMKRAIHFDFHNMPGIDGLGNFDAEETARRLKDSHIKYVNLFAECNIGFCYYPTKVGIPYPGMPQDVFGNLLKACHAQGIGVTGYFNGGLDHEHALLHKDWIVVNEKGETHYENYGENFFRVMCYNSGYRDFKLALIKEFIEMYPAVDGVYIDCLVDWPICHCPACKKKAEARGLDPNSEEDLKIIRDDALESFCRDIKKIVGPDRYLRLSNPIESRLLDVNTHVELECLPPEWGYDACPATAPYFRNLHPETVYMTGRFLKSWGDFGGTRTKASLEYDIWDSYMQAIGISIGDHMHPVHGPEPAVYDMIKDLYADVIRYEPYTEDAKAVTDVAVLLQKEFPDDACYGLSRMLGELHYSFDILYEFADFSKYNVIILPDNVRITPRIREILRKHLDAGKGVISTGTSGLNIEGTAFDMPDWNMTFEGMDPDNKSYLRVCRPTDSDILDKIPDMDFDTYVSTPSIRMKAGKGAKVLAKYVSAFFNRGWDGRHHYCYLPPKGETEYDTAVQSEKVYQICFPIFASYYSAASLPHKLLVAHCLKELLPEPSVVAEDLPSYGRVALTKKENKTMVHVKLSVPEPRGRVLIIEDHIRLPQGLEVKVKGKFSKATVAPDGKPLAITYRDGYTCLTLPEICGYIMAVLE